MEPTRPPYWNVAGKEVMYLVLALQVAVLGIGLYRAYRRWRTAFRLVQLVRRDELGPRLRQVLAQAVAQRRLLRERGAGLAHLAFSWGFALLLLGTTVAMLDEDFGIPVMRGAFYLWFQSLALDLAGLAAAVGLVAMLWRRYVLQESRLRDPADRRETVLDACVPIGFLLIVVTGFAVEGLRITVTHDPWGRWSPVGYVAGAALRAALRTDAALLGLHAGLWWFHLVLASAFVAAIPYTKLAHLVTAPLNVFFAPIAGRPEALALRPVDFEGSGPIGLGTLEALGGKETLDLAACVQCGRCQAACPAYATGQPLSPKALVADLRDHVRGRPPRPPVNLAPGQERPLASEGLPPLAAAVSPEAIWTCVTCGACVEACPIGVQHVPTIIEMRRHLVMETASYPERLQGALANLEARGSPYQGTSTSRTAWTRGLDVPRMAQRRRADYLFWVGCAGAFDERAQKVTRAITTVLSRAGVDYAILGDEESCTGDAARRIGDELQFTTCAQRVIETLGRYEFQAIVTGCAHCFNSLKNEYPRLGGNYRVLHHTELLRDLLAAGRLRPTAKVDGTVTFHDPCYLGRYNGQYDAPREVLRAIPGVRAVEMARGREASFCCGSGGGHAWMGELSGGRISHARADQVIATKARTVATACPFCASMLKDGLAVRGPASGTQVLDVAEIVELTTRREGQET
jgi:Fe-S oxidoreductase/nitrate reductase gamma subunit